MIVLFRRGISKFAGHSPLSFYSSTRIAANGTNEDNGKETIANSKLSMSNSSAPVSKSFRSSYNNKWKESRMPGELKEGRRRKRFHMTGKSSGDDRHKFNESFRRERGDSSFAHRAKESNLELGEGGALIGDDDAIDNDLLADLDYIENELNSNSYDEIVDVDPEDEGDDPLDDLLTRAFIESHKTSSKEYETFMVNPLTHQVQVPVSRSMIQLQYSLQPKLTVDQNSSGYSIGESVWHIVSRNRYFQDFQKVRMADGIAKEYNKVQELLKSQKTSKMDLVLDPAFRKGPQYLREQEIQERQQIISSNAQRFSETS